MGWWPVRRAAGPGHGRHKFRLSEGGRCKEHGDSQVRSGGHDPRPNRVSGTPSARQPGHRCDGAGWTAQGYRDEDAGEGGDSMVAGQ
ncbi:hypothetical protein FA95DRAFT_634553 [Auriscalpium vulgare]|uniref:Uncharacterized protein n=1 Tax=Auriscalpium vulgare TaxID=40419 RepID=A0ACB8REA1_9AGAM|nr:hypothetical protein FA95DRAFT_634553 [Auriscalpium vulgare]